jgi:hypothetical protein
MNSRKVIEDQISTANALFYTMMNKSKTYKKESSLGERLKVELMYALTQPDSYSGYDTLSLFPTDGITAAFFDWAQMSVPIMISGKERKQNKGENAIINLMTTKVKQATLGIKEYFAKTFIQGNGVNTAAQCRTPYTSPNNGSIFIDPIAKLLDFDPTQSRSVGNINQSTYTWWRNQTKTSTAANYAAFFAELDNHLNNCSKGPGGRPDIHFSDQNFFEFYCKALRTFHRNPTFARADIPFHNVALYDDPMVWDEFAFNAATENTTLVTTQGSLWSFNSQFIGITVDSDTDFAPDDWHKPDNQDAMASHILWMGASWVSNRRKHGVLADVDTTIVA